jgi:hypothetical protein
VAKGIAACDGDAIAAVKSLILTKPEEIETSLTAPAEEALKLQRPLPDGSLKIVATGVKKDEAAS